MKLLVPLTALSLMAGSLYTHIAHATTTADPNLARNLAATCAGCHGTNGKAIPGAGMHSLAGTDKVRIRQQLADYKSGVMPATIMHQIAKGFTDEQLDLITAYFAAQK